MFLLKSEGIRTIRQLPSMSIGWHSENQVATAVGVISLDRALMTSFHTSLRELMTNTSGRIGLMEKQTYFNHIIITHFSAFCKNNNIIM